MNTVIIGIAGGTGSGKTTLANEIRTHFGGNIPVISHDSYYRAQDELSAEERVKINYDEPAAFETELLTEHLRRLKSGETVQIPQYDYTRHTRAPETEEIRPGSVIILEGILIFSDPDLLDLIDIKIYVDTEADIRILRRAKRDMAERGRSFDSITNQYLATVRKMHERYVEPTKWNADIIIPNGTNPVALDMICEKIEKLLAQE
ncbi:MAG: uridine kinase [Clostridia bacterium]|nr:uridine kinase [Clostridia bacterium]